MKDETKIIIEERIKKLEEAVSELKKYRLLNEVTFSKDKRSQFAAMYALIIGIEAICDIGNHILAKYFNRACDSYKDIILSLADCYVIPKTFAQKNAEMTDFRNILIHLYAKVDTKEVYKNLKKAPEEFTKFASYFLKFLEK